MYLHLCLYIYIYSIYIYIYIHTVIGSRPHTDSNFQPPSGFPKAHGAFSPSRHQVVDCTNWSIYSRAQDERSAGPNGGVGKHQAQKDGPRPAKYFMSDRAQIKTMASTSTR